jgi:hypothetical protein
MEKLKDMLACTIAGRRLLLLGGGGDLGDRVDLNARLLDVTDEQGQGDECGSSSCFRRQRSDCKRFFSRRSARANLEPNNGSPGAVLSSG